MKICQVPMYCGGRFLIGLYNPLKSYNDYYKTPDFYMKHLEKEQINLSNLYGELGDPHPYLPETLELFQQCLKKGLYTDSGMGGYQGVVTAVTNASQTIAADWLSKSGFKTVGQFSKYKIGDDKCTLWVGDYLNDIYPIISKVPSYGFEGELKSAKRARFS